MTRRLTLIFAIAGLICLPAAAFGPATHAYIAMQACESNNPDIFFGAMAPDCSQTLSNENPTEASVLNQLTHREFDRVAESCFGLGISTHNGIWGADYYAHLVFTSNPEEIYSVVKIRQLSTEFGISVGSAEGLFEMALDYLIRLENGPEVGTLIVRSAEASGEANAQALADAYAAQLSSRVSGLSLEKAQEDIRYAHDAFKKLTSVYGQQLQQAVEPLRVTLMPLFAGYLGVDVNTAETYFARTIEVCSDYKTEIDRIVSILRPQLYELDCPAMEGEGDGEGEGEEEPYVVDFCESFFSVSTNPLLRQVGDQFMELIVLIDPQTADVNGSFTVDVSNMENPAVEVNGNGITDAANELALLAKILATPGFDNGILTHDSVRAAWEHNWDQLLNGNIGPVYAPVLIPVAPGLLEILVGYVTVGDGGLTSSSYYAASGNGSFGFVAGMMTVLNDGITEKFGLGLNQPELDAADFVRLGALWPDADADGDGYTNRQEYNYFTPAVCFEKSKSSSTIDYVNAALMASICPTCADCPDCVPSVKSLYEVGQSACLRVPGDMAPETAFLWSKAGAEPLEDGRYIGVRCKTLSIPYVQIEDSGTYTCTYGGEKASYSITILVAEQVPLTGVAGLGMLIGVIALGSGIRMLRRGKA